jgi:AraC-like DNA-binding protein
MFNSSWIPPFYLYLAGRGSVSDVSYRNEVASTPPPPRLLIKHTLEGEGVIYIKERREVLYPGDVFIIERPGPYVYCYEGNGVPWRFEYVSISFTNPGGLLPRELAEKPVFKLDSIKGLRDKLLELIESRIASGTEIKLSHSALAYSFFLDYISARLASDSDSNSIALKLKGMLDDNLGNSVSVAGLCSTLGYTQEALTRIFKKTFGVPPGRYLQLARLRKACNLMMSGNVSVKEVSFFSGFDSQNYFARVFKKNIGISPRDFMKTPDPLAIEKIIPHNINLKP